MALFDSHSYYSFFLSSSTTNGGVAILHLLLHFFLHLIHHDVFISFIDDVFFSYVRRHAGKYVLTRTKTHSCYTVEYFV